MTDASNPKRLYISGIAPSLSCDELSKRLQNYGALEAELKLNDKNAQTTGIFAHCTLNLNGAAWSRLRKLSGTVLKGSRLKIEEAKQDWTTKLATDQKRPEPSAPNPRKRPTPGTIVAVESKRVKRGEVVKDASISQKSRKQGWIKGRYGRAIAILKTENGVKLSRNPDSLSRLWGSAHPTPDQLTYYYDDEEDQWHDRRGRVIRDVEITKKRQAVEDRAGGRVEIWGSDDDEPKDVAQDEYTVASSALPDYTPADVEDIDMNEEEIEAQLQKERAAGLSLLGDMFKDEDKIEATQTLPKQEPKRARDKFDIVQRFDPNAPDAESESEVDEVADADVMQDNASPAPDVNEPVILATDVDLSEDDEEEPLPSFMRPSGETVAAEDLTSIFKPRAQQETVSFNLFANDESMPDGDDPPDIALDRGTQDIHPDRLNRPEETNQVEDDVEGNANFTALTKDRGFNLAKAFKPTEFPMLLAQDMGSFSFFSTAIDMVDVKARWEASRSDLTHDWKRKSREGGKKMRKANNRQAMRT